MHTLSFTTLFIDTPEQQENEGSKDEDFYSRQVSVNIIIIMFILIAIIFLIRIKRNRKKVKDKVDLEKKPQPKEKVEPPVVIPSVIPTITQDKGQKEQKKSDI